MSENQSACWLDVPENIEDFKDMIGYYEENEENKEEIEDYKYCLNQLNILTSLISTCNIKCSGFSEILCNID